MTRALGLATDGLSDRIRNSGTIRLLASSLFALAPA